MSEKNYKINVLIPEEEVNERIKAVGETSVDIKLYTEVTGKLNIKVEAE